MRNVNFFTRWTPFKSSVLQCRKWRKACRERVEETEEKPWSILLEDFGGDSDNRASASDERLETCVVEDTWEGDVVSESKESQDLFIPCQQNHPSRQDIETTENCEPLSDDGVQLSGKGLEEGWEQQAHKHLKVKPPE